MDIIIKEIDLSDDEKIKEFNEIQQKVEFFLSNRYSNLSKIAKKKEKTKINLKLATKTTVKMDLVKYTYNKLFSIPDDGIYDENKLEIIKKHLKRKNLI